MRRQASVWAVRLLALAYPFLAFGLLFVCARFLLAEAGVARSDLYAAVIAGAGVLVNSPEFARYLLRAFRLPVNQ